MRRPGCESGGRVARHPGDSNRSDRLNDSWLHMPLSITFSIWGGIWSGPNTIGILG